MLVSVKGGEVNNILDSIMRSPSKTPKESLLVLQSDIDSDAPRNNGKDNDGDADMGQEGE